MNHSTTAEVHSTELTEWGDVRISLDNGQKFQAPKKNHPRAGDKVRVDYSWGEAYAGTVTPLRRARTYSEGIER